jgi:carboxymethylenebutenolidase
MPGGQITITARDGFAPGAYLSSPTCSPKGGIVLLHEIFGVNAHIREVCDGFASRGYVAVAPALFDRAENGVELGYDAEGINKGRRLREAIGWDKTLFDVQAAVEAVRSAGAVAVIGYCWGGTLAFLSTTRLAGVACAVGYYGGQTVPFAREIPKVPLMLHFGEFDPRIPLKDVEEIRGHNPQIEIHMFPADHGFNCDHRQEWDERSAREALKLTLEFLDRHIR